AVYYRPPKARLFERLGNTLWPADSQERALVQDAKHIFFWDTLIERGAELRVHTEPKRYPTCEHLSLEAWYSCISHSDEDYVVVDKPSGVPCAPHVSNGREWLVPFVAAALASKRRHKYQSRAPLTPCQRLDVQTSGLVALARSPDAARSFQQLLLDGQVQKRYRALVCCQSEQQLEVNQQLMHKISDSVFGKPAPRLIAPMDAAVGGSGHKWRDARATILSIRTSPGCKELTEVEIQLHTGRTHQLRAQLAAIGFPIVNDCLYGKMANFIWKDASDDQLAASLVECCAKEAKEALESSLALQCSDLSFRDQRFQAGAPWWRKGLQEVWLEIYPIC
ncbi:RNA pseudouridine synthase 6, partial [Durusdinium trenchii]